MVKQNTAPAKTTVIATPSKVEGSKAKPQIIGKVKAGMKYKGARAAWYEVLLKHEGKPAADFLAACTTKPPSVPKSGVVEKASGWLGFFTRSGVATLQ